MTIDIKNAQEMLNGEQKVSGEVDPETAGFIAALLKDKSPAELRRAGLTDAIWERIARDDELKRARQKLSVHELRLIIRHALDVAEPRS